MNVFQAHERELLSELINNDIDFLVVGGAAVVLHGHDRLRDDLDLLLSQEDANLERLDGVCLTWLHFDRKKIDGMKRANARLKVEELGVDILTSVEGILAENAFATKIIITADGLDVPVLSKELLIVSKKAVGEQKDLEDVKALS